MKYRYGTLVLALVTALSLVPRSAGANEKGLRVVRITSGPDAAQAYLRPTEDPVRQWIAGGALQPAQVRIGFHGVPGQATPTAAQGLTASGQGISTVVVVDMSGSVSRTERTRIQTAVKKFIDGMGPNDQTAIVAFWDRVTVLPFSQDKPKLKDFIDNVPRPSGRYTLLLRALSEALDIAKNPPTSFVVVLAFSDGEDESLGQTRLLTTEYLKHRVPLYALSVQHTGGNILQRTARQNFEGMAVATGGRAEPVERDLQQLETAFAKVRSDYQELVVVSFKACGLGAAGTTLDVDFTFGPGATPVAFTAPAAFLRHSNFGAAPCRCADDSGCAAPKPYCHAASGDCVACLNNGHCDGANGMFCDTSSHACQADPLCIALQNANVATIVCSVKDAAAGGQVLLPSWAEARSKFCPGRKFGEIVVTQEHRGPAVVECRFEDAAGVEVARATATAAIEPHVPRTVELQWTVGGTTGKTEHQVKVDPNPCNPACQPWELCQAGSCQPKACTADTDCAPGGVCDNGACRADHVCTPPCAACQDCASGSCQPKACTTDADCGTGTGCECDAGKCQEAKTLWLIYGALALTAILIGLLIALLLRRGRHVDEPPKTGGEPEEPEEIGRDLPRPPKPIEPVAPAPPPDPQPTGPSEGFDPRRTRDEDGPHRFVKLGPQESRPKPEEATTTPFSLEIVGGLVPKGERHILRPLTIVGAEEDCHLRFNADRVSSHHAEIQVFPAGTVFVTDLQSTNGTKVGSYRLSGGQRLQVYPGDILSFSSDVQARLVGPPDAPTRDGGDAGGGGGGSGSDRPPSGPSAPATPNFKKTIVD